jgi:hypothetical protein
MALNTLKLVVVILALGPLGCQRPKPTPASPALGTASTASGNRVGSGVRNNAFALLSELLNEEKHLSKILIIKLESPELDRLIKDISRTAADGAKFLDAMARTDPGLKGARTDLPAGEHVTREAIAETKKKLLLDSKGSDFEFNLLLTQAEALNYAAHLAFIVGNNEPDPNRARHIAALQKQLKQLHDEVLALLRKR